MSQYITTLDWSIIIIFSMNNFATQFMYLAQQLKSSHHKDPKHHLESPAFIKMVEKVKNTKDINFKIPQKFPYQVTEGIVHCVHGMRISLFFLPKGTKIPIHDHPKMFVICKVLRGKLIYNQYTLKQKSYQITTPQRYLQIKCQSQNFQFPSISATKKTKVIQANCLNYITPDTNLHCMQAVQDSIFLDVICPDYDQVQIFLNTYEQIKKSGKDQVILQMGPPRLVCPPIISIDFV